MVPLGVIETSIGFMIWSSAVFTSLYHLYFVGKAFNHNQDELFDDFEKGWSIVGRFKDKSDYEWNVWSLLTIKLTPWLMLNFLGAEFLRAKGRNKTLPIWYAAVTICVVLYNFNVLIVLLFLFQTLIFFLCVYFQNIYMIWIFGYLVRHLLKPEDWFNVEEYDLYLIMVSSSWMILRCMSFSIDTIHKTSKENELKINEQCCILVGYSFYLPTMFCGPFITYQAFRNGLWAPYQVWTVRRSVEVIKSFARCIFWYYFTELALHFIYVNAILLRPYLVETLFNWELAGLGIAMGHFFHLKYIVFYGLPSAWATAERYVMPQSPCCVSRVYLYSFMWRHFDNGLYQFLVSYIYIPLKPWLSSHLLPSELLCKVSASMACFLFVFVWHGLEEFVFYWVVFNFIAVTLEGAGKALCDVPFVRQGLDNRLSPPNQRRLHCLFSAPLHYFSMVSNYFFIGSGMEVGRIYMNKFLYSDLYTFLIILFFLYGAAQAAVTVEMREKRLKKIATD